MSIRGCLPHCFKDIKGPVASIALDKTLRCRQLGSKKPASCTRWLENEGNTLRCRLTSAPAAASTRHARTFARVHVKHVRPWTKRISRDRSNIELTIRDDNLLNKAKKFQ